MLRADTASSPVSSSPALAQRPLHIKLHLRASVAFADIFLQERQRQAVPRWRYMEVDGKQGEEPAPSGGGAHKAVP